MRSRPLPRLPCLPDEILLQIFQTAELTKPDLKNARLSCRGLTEVPATVLFRSVSLPVTLHHNTGCSSHSPTPNAREKIDRKNDKDNNNFPHTLLPLPRSVRIFSKGPDDSTKERECEKHACKLDLRTCRKFFSAAFLSRVPNLKRVEVDLDPRFITQQQIILVNGALKCIAREPPMRCTVRYRNVRLGGANSEVFIKGVNDIPVVRLTSLDLSFRDETISFHADLRGLHKALGALLNRAKTLERLRLEARGKLRNGQISLESVLENAGDVVFNVTSLDLDGVGCSGVSRHNVAKLRKATELSLRGQSAEGFLALLADCKHALTWLGTDRMREEFFSYISSAPRGSLGRVEVYKNRSWSASNEAMMARFWSEAFPKMREGIKYVRVFGCRTRSTRRLVKDVRPDRTPAYKLGRQTTLLHGSTLAVPASTTLKTLSFCVKAGRRFHHAVKDLIMSSEKLRFLEFCFHVDGAKQVDITLTEFRRMLATCRPWRKDIVIETWFSDPERHKCVGENNLGVRCFTFTFGSAGWKDTTLLEF